MPSTYTTNSGIELIATGEQSGTWGVTTNNNLSIIDRLTNGVGTITLVGSTHILTTSDGTLSDGQYKVLVFDGSLIGTNTVTISPDDAQHLYFVKNTTSQSVVLTQGSGTSVTVPAGKSAIVYSDGGGSSANVVDLTNTFDFQPLAATLTAIAGLSTTDGNFIVGDGSTWVAESGNTAIASLGVTATAAELNVLDGITATTAELNILDGVTATTAELNILDGVTATTAELNYNDITTLGTSEASKVVTADANGDVNLAEELKAKSYNETYATASSSSGALTINCEAGNVFEVTLTENVTSTSFSNPPASGTAFGLTLRVVQDSTARTIAWPAAVKWPGGTAPTLTDTSGGIDVFTFFTTDAGTTWYGFISGQNFS